MCIRDRRSAVPIDESGNAALRLRLTEMDAVQILLSLFRRSVRFALSTITTVPAEIRPSLIAAQLSREISASQF